MKVLRKSGSHRDRYMADVAEFYPNAKGLNAKKFNEAYSSSYWV